MIQPIPNNEPAAEVRVDAESFHTVRAIALRQMRESKELKEKRKAIREQKQNLLENDVILQDALSALEERMTEIKELKAKVVNQPEFLQLKLKEKELTEEINELGESITNHLVNYSKMTGSDYLEDEEGNELRIKYKISVSSGQLRLF